MKLESGDPIEIAEARWIRDNLPLYEAIWARYIGNDGKGNALPLSGIPATFAAKRDKFNQSHYSILLCLLILRDDCEQYRHSLGEVRSIAQYLKTMRDLTCFMTHVGRIRDLFEAISLCLNTDDSVWTRFSDFYAARNVVMHGSVIPIQLDESMVKLPPFETVNHVTGAYGSKSVWEETKNATHTMLVDFMDQTFAKLLELVSASLSQVLDRMKQIVSGSIMDAPWQLIEVSPRPESGIPCGSAMWYPSHPSGVKFP